MRSAAKWQDMVLVPDDFGVRQPWISYRVIVILRSAAMRSASGGCVLNRRENICPAESGATMQSADVDGEMFIGMRLL